MQNVLLLRVGIDTNNAGCHSPIFEDGSFEYIPIPEREKSKENRFYKDIDARNYGTLGNYLPEKLKSSKPHFDPEFKSYTYGDPSKLKRSQLKSLRENDLLIFYSGFESVNSVEFHPRLFCIGYFVVKETLDLEVKEKRAEAVDMFSQNAHIKRKRVTDESCTCDLYPVIVKGKSDESVLFKNLRILSTPDRNMIPSLADSVGYDSEKDLTYAGTARRLMPGGKVEKIEKWLKNGINSILKDRMHFVNRKETDFTVENGYIILSKSNIKIDEIQKGDWIVIFDSKKRYEIKCVLLIDQNLSDRHGKKAKKIKNKIDRHDEKYILSSLFWLFKDKNLDIPDKLRSEIDFYQKKDTNTEVDSNKISNFISYLEYNYRIGVHRCP